jgi:hypothetical protein
MLAQLTSFVGFVGGLVAALWHARKTAAGGGKSALALAALWVLAFAVLTAVGVYHHLLSFYPHY